MCVEIVVEINVLKPYLKCVLKPHPKCVCWNCDWDVCVETVPEMRVEMFVLKTYLKMCVLKITVVHLKSNCTP